MINRIYAHGCDNRFKSLEITLCQSTSLYARILTHEVASIQAFDLGGDAKMPRTACLTVRRLLERVLLDNAGFELHIPHRSVGQRPRDN